MLNPDQFGDHPHMNEYNIEVGNTGQMESGVGMVRTTRLAQMPGNATRPEGVERYRQALRAGEGFKDPVMVIFDPDNKRAYVGEGNHRLRAAGEEGHSHVPVRVVRGRISDSTVDYVQSRQRGGLVGRADTANSPWRTGYQQKDTYWPPQMHPRYVFPEDTKA